AVLWKLPAVRGRRRSQGTCGRGTTATGTAASARQPAGVSPPTGQIRPPAFCRNHGTRWLGLGHLGCRLGIGGCGRGGGRAAGLSSPLVLQVPQVVSCRGRGTVTPEGRQPGWQAGRCCTAQGQRPLP